MPTPTSIIIQDAVTFWGILRFGQGLEDTPYSRGETKLAGWTFMQDYTLGRLYKLPDLTSCDNFGELNVSDDEDDYDPRSYMIYSRFTEEWDKD